MCHNVSVLRGEICDTDHFMVRMKLKVDFIIRSGKRGLISISPPWWLIGGSGHLSQVSQSGIGSAEHLLEIELPSPT